MMTLLAVFGFTLAAFLLVIVGMAVGVMMGRRAISGSCGGLANREGEGGDTSCSLCSSPAAACSELKNRMNGRPASDGAVDSVACEKDCVEEGCSKEEIDACKSH